MKDYFKKKLVTKNIQILVPSEWRLKRARQLHFLAQRSSYQMDSCAAARIEIEISPLDDSTKS